MTAKEAYKRITERFKMWNLVKCHEYKTIFVFQFVPKDWPKGKPINRLLNSTVSIDKKTGIIKPFNPMEIPLDEFRSGVEITDFK